jgi:hypothetical protein
MTQGISVRWQLLKSFLVFEIRALHADNFYCSYCRRKCKERKLKKLMSNHSRLLAHVPERPAGFDPSVEEVLAWLEEVAGEEIRAGIAQAVRNFPRQRLGDWEELVMQRNIAVPAVLVGGRLACRFSGCGKLRKLLAGKMPTTHHRRDGRVPIAYVLARIFTLLFDHTRAGSKHRGSGRCRCGACFRSRSL